VTRPRASESWQDARMKSICALASFAVACGGSPKEVAVEGSDTSLVQLAGDWSGEYKGNESGRTGTVSFSLQLGRHVAEGEVIMGGNTPLKIEFVQVQQGQIKGTIARYTDPNCSCDVETSFIGKLAGSSIAGDFETRIASTGKIQTGTWTVARKAK
jgi:hypothetical protein